MHPNQIFYGIIFSFFILLTGCGRAADAQLDLQTDGTETPAVVKKDALPSVVGAGSGCRYLQDPNWNYLFLTPPARCTAPKPSAGHYCISVWSGNTAGKPTPTIYRWVTIDEACEIFSHLASM